MHALIVYATTEGHTRDLAHFIWRRLNDSGCSATVEPAAPDGVYPDPAGYDLVLLAGSLHVGRFQASLTAYARAHQARLNAMRTAFIAVSLSAAGVNPRDWAGADEAVQQFLQETDWRPAAVHHAAGAIRYAQYDFFKRLALMYIAAQRGGPALLTPGDHDLTDYAALERFVLDFASASAAPAPAPATGSR